MQRSATQFVIALTLSLFLGAATLAAVIAEVTGKGESDLTMPLVIGLVGANAQAIAYLFRLENGVARGEPPAPPGSQ
ncbi:hypothetical protein LCGC14_1599770 [marine sediment metagenome]|uniref:Uncharacterized protein n=1 Tax=marine sediment metagenome TaxID=412755 RepID=A0A0F9IBU1_9ZZZZ